MRAVMNFLMPVKVRSFLSGQKTVEFSRRALLQSAVVSEEHITSIFRVEDQDRQDISVKAMASKALRVLGSQLTILVDLSTPT
jgi:hypothetical protein